MKVVFCFAMLAVFVSCTAQTPPQKRSSKPGTAPAKDIRRDKMPVIKPSGDTSMKMPVVPPKPGVVPK